MAGEQAELLFADELRMFLAPRYRGTGRARVTCDGTSTAASRLSRGSHTVAEVAPVRRPQGLPAPRFVLDVHLGTLARRLRLLGIDTAYANDRDDDALIAQAGAEGRVLLTQDRGL